MLYYDPSQKSRKPVLVTECDYCFGLLFSVLFACVVQELKDTLI